MIVDATIFCGESDMLEFRIRLLEHCVDRFIVIEADRTFQGEPRHETLLNCHPKVSVRRVKTEWDGGDWTIEHAQRNALADACKEFADDDLLIWGDVDEIPSPLIIRLAKLRCSPLPACCEQAFFYYRLNHLRDEVWCGSILTTIGHMRQIGGQALRDERTRVQTPNRQSNRHGASWNGNVDPAGWHLSYFGGVSQIQKKIRSFSHKEFNRPEYLDERHLSHCVQTGQGPFNCDTKIIPVGREFFPEHFLKYAPEKWFL